MSQHRKTLLGLVGLVCITGSIPYITRKSQTQTLVEKERLTGSQRQRGMNLMGGTQDGGADPNWDVKTGTYKAHRKKSGTGATTTTDNAISKEAGKESV